MTDARRLPILPLRDTVLLPGVVVPVAAGRSGTLAALDAALAAEGDDASRLLALAQKDAEGGPEVENLHAVGVVVRVLQVQEFPGGKQLLIEAETRARVLRTEDVDGRLEAELVPLEDLPLQDPSDPALEALVKEVRRRARTMGERAGVPLEAIRKVFREDVGPGELADRVAFQLDITSAEKQSLLEDRDPESRLRGVLLHLSRIGQVQEAAAKLQADVQEELSDRQKEMFLRQQMKAIQKELGEEDDDRALEELRETLEAAPLPEKARQEVERGLKRAARLNRESAEAQVVWTWLEWMASLPWGERTEDDLDIGRAREILDQDHHGLDDVKDRVLEYLAVRRLRARTQAIEAEAAEEGPGARAAAARRRGEPAILLFVGPPGTGKTSVAESIARSLGRRYERIALGGARDEADIRGHRRTYVGAMPGRIVQGLKRAGVTNPVFCLDEIDKLGRGFQGDPGAALLEVLDPAQNHAFEDRYLDVPVDLSEVLFVCTANFLEGIPGPLLDRMEVISFAGYTEREKRAIARRYLLPRRREGAGLAEDQVEVADEALEKLISGWTREAGVRQLDRELGRLCRKVALEVAEGRAERIEVTPEKLRPLLGRPKVRPEARLPEDEVGVATGMYYTQVGGDVMFVEASVTPGRGDGRGGLTLTGQLGDVMKESAHAALTYARSHAEPLGIPRERLGGAAVHLHVPAGAIPKDGPSAGVTLATALVSELSGRPVRAELAMTGEITLRGKVLPIGGLKEKVLGAARAGITEVVLPAENEADLEDLPEDVREALTFHPVRHLEEVLAVALRGEGGKPTKLERVL